MRQGRSEVLEEPRPSSFLKELESLDIPEWCIYSFLSGTDIRGWVAAVHPQEALRGL